MIAVCLTIFDNIFANQSISFFAFRLGALGPGKFQHLNNASFLSLLTGVCYSVYQIVVFCVKRYVCACHDLCISVAFVNQF